MNNELNKKANECKAKEIAMKKINLSAKFSDLQELFSLLKRHRSLLLSLGFDTEIVDDELYKVHVMLSEIQNEFNLINEK